jgi:hypothetical protein
MISSALGKSHLGRQRMSIANASLLYLTYAYRYAHPLPVAIDGFRKTALE